MKLELSFLFSYELDFGELREHFEVTKIDAFMKRFCVLLSSQEQLEELTKIPGVVRCDNSFLIRQLDSNESKIKLA